MEANLQSLMTRADLENGLERSRKELCGDLREEFRVIHAKLDRIILEVRWAVAVGAALAIALSQLPHLL